MSGTVLVTGRGGFVGRHLTTAVHDRGWTVKGLAADVRDLPQLKSEIGLAVPDVVVHLAALSNVGSSFEQPGTTFEVNFTGTFNLLLALRESGFQGRMLYVGSADTYGKVESTELPITEEHILQPRNPYSVSKVAAEALCYQWSQSEGFDIVMARPFNHIGPGQSEGFAITDFAKQLAEIENGTRDRRISVGRIDVTRDFTDVRDIVRAYMGLIERGKTGHIYNVGSGKETKLKAVLDMLIEYSGLDIEISQDQTRVRKTDLPRVCADVKKIKRDVGWEPKIPLATTLEDVFEDWKMRVA